MPRHPVELFDFLRAAPGNPGTPLWVLPAWVAGAVAIGELQVLLGRFGAYVLVALIGAGYLGWWWRQRSRRREFALRVEFAERRPPRMAGLILPLSTISVSGASPREKEALADLLAADHTGDAPLEEAHGQLLARSNLLSAVAALEFHYCGAGAEGQAAGQWLRECWLITTADVETPDGGEPERGSCRVGPLLARWFFTRNPSARGQVTFHHKEYAGRPLCVRPRDYAGMAALVEAIFRHAPYKAGSLIAEIAPGTKPMTLAVALACLAPGRTMQYMATHRDPLTGEVLPQGRPVPVLIDVDPYLETSERE